MGANEGVIAVVDRISKEDPFKIEPFGYVDGTVPKGYKCGACGAESVKLWREYQTFMDHQTLSCAKCALKRVQEVQEGRDEKSCKYEGPADGDGKVSVSFPSSPHHPAEKTDQIGGLVPAVPTKDGKSFWGYTSVPQVGVDWWKRLPSYPIPKG